jgi:hypothetical protein
MHRELEMLLEDFKRDVEDASNAFFPEESRHHLRQRGLMLLDEIDLQNIPGLAGDLLPILRKLGHLPPAVLDRLGQYVLEVGASSDDGVLLARLVLVHLDPSSTFALTPNEVAKLRAALAECTRSGSAVLDFLNENPMVSAFMADHR